MSAAGSQGMSPVGRGVASGKVVAVPTFLAAALGALTLFLAGFVRGGLRTSADPELVLGASYALGGLGLMAVLAAGVAWGVTLTRS